MGFAVSSPDYPPATGSPWAHTAEPFRDTTFRAVPAVGNPAQDVFKWTFEDGTVFEGRYERHPGRGHSRRRRLFFRHAQQSNGERQRERKSKKETRDVKYERASKALANVRISVVLAMSEAWVVSERDQPSLPPPEFDHENEKKTKTGEAVK